MSEVARSFIDDWVAENVPAEGVAAPGGMTRARELAAQCQAEAAVEGITDAELDAAAKEVVGGGDGLVELIAQAMEAAAEAAQRRPADGDG